jgi:hypothetical protein
MRGFALLALLIATFWLFVLALYYVPGWVSCSWVLLLIVVTILDKYG